MNESAKNKDFAEKWCANYQEKNKGAGLRTKPNIFVKYDKLNCAVCFVGYDKGVFYDELNFDFSFAEFKRRMLIAYDFMKNQKWKSMEYQEWLKNEQKQA